MTFQDGPLAADYPALFRSADALSTTGQRRRKQLLGLTLTVDLLAAALGGISHGSGRVAFGILVCLLIGLSLTILLLATRPERRWYLGRALSESVKTLTWRFMACCEPYVFGLPPGEAERTFVRGLSRLLKEHSSLGPNLFVQGGQDLQITQKMMNIRSLSSVDRRDFYLKYRVRDQQGWYAAKASGLARAAIAVKFLIVVLQLAAAVCAALLFASPQQAYSAVGLLTTAVASVAAWQQLNQYETLAEAYGLTAQELAGIQSLAGQVATDQQLSEFVANAERAISREHTMWLARRREP